MSRSRVLVTLLFTTAVVAAPTPAHAASSFEVRATISPNGGATAWLSDTIVPSNRYLLTLTATGGGTCGIPGPTVQIVDSDVQGYANPVTATTSGACALYNATVVYTVTWNGDPGTTGQVPIYCVWVRGARQCSPTSFSIPAPE